MTQDVLAEIIETEKAAADLIARAKKAAVLKMQETERRISAQEQELKQELKHQRQALQKELETEYAKETAKARQKTAARLEKIKLTEADLSGAADYLAQKILA
ncbi:MAG: hypothetical protein LBD99_05820 [Candidatus Margulisbacteria bacterium]|jgi:vacuolar-type H+-ATPase subunit H|nr:hypothetical protein [Candidatus Margulisiibacteriota bacterium]